MHVNVISVVSANCQNDNNFIAFLHFHTLRVLYGNVQVQETELHQRTNWIMVRYFFHHKYFVTAGPNVDNP